MPTAHCLLPTDNGFDSAQPDTNAYCLLPTDNGFDSAQPDTNAYCLLPTDNGFDSAQPDTNAYCLLPTAYCPLLKSFPKRKIELHTFPRRMCQI
jgi:hypothetical protein